MYRRYVWECRLKPKCRLLNLKDVGWEKAWIWLKQAGIKTVEELLKEIYKDEYTFQNVAAEVPMSASDEEILEYLTKEITQKQSKKQSYLWYRALRIKLNSSSKIAQVFSEYDALLDDGDKTSYGFFMDYEPQLVVLNPDAVEMRLIEGKDSHNYLKTS